MTYWIAWHFSFLLDVDHILHNTTFKQRAAFTLVFAGFKKCVVEHRHCFITICICENVGKYKIGKRTAFPFVLWCLKIRVLSIGTGNLNLSGRRQAYAARGQRGEPA